MSNDHEFDLSHTLRLNGIDDVNSWKPADLTGAERSFVLKFFNWKHVSADK